MEYRTVIIDECGTVRIFVDDCRDGEVDEILANHPEWRLETISVD